VTVDLVLTNTKAYLKGEIVDCCFAIEEGIIQKIGNETQMPRADEKTDLQHKLILPGCIDSHVHLRDEGKAYKETFLTGTEAAAAGGFTTLLDMPNNQPITMSAHSLRDRMQIAQRQVFVDVGFYSEFPTKLDQVKAIAAEGAVGLKLFMGEQIGGLNIDDDEAIREGFSTVTEVGLQVAVHAEDHLMLKKAMDLFKLAKKDQLSDFLKAHSASIELQAVQRMLKIANQIKKLHLHFCHVSTQKALQAIVEAKKTNKSITCEVTPHHLLLNKDDDYLRVGVSALTLPPLRDKEDVAELWKGIAEGTVDSIGSDHAPHTLEEKESRRIWDVKAGIPGLETTLPLILTAVHKRRITLARAIELLSEKPAAIFRLLNKGSLEEGKRADLIVVDFNIKWKIDASKFKSKAKFSPFNKSEIQGKPVKTYLGGQLIMDEDEIVARPGSGRIIRRKNG
jgi:dihydroorotase